MKILRFFFQRKNKAVAPEIFHSVEAFQAALRGHSEVQRCFAWGQFILDTPKRQADCIIYAVAYRDHTPDQPLFSMVHTIYKGVCWPLARTLEDNLTCIIDQLNAFPVLCR